jgi:hypothetical protein
MLEKFLPITRAYESKTIRQAMDDSLTQKFHK